MYVRSLRILGLADLPEFHASDLGRRVSIQGPSRQSTAVGDGLSLLFAALSEDGLQQLLLRWGLIQARADAEVEVEGTPIQAMWPDRRLAESLVSDHTHRKVEVEAELALDPPLCTELRRHAAREPRLAVSLGADQTVTIRVSAFFGQSWDVISISVQSIVIGGERFATTSAERAGWLNWLLVEIGRRFISHDETTQHAEVALACMISAKEGDHQAYQRWAQLMNARYPQSRVAKHGDSGALFLAEDRPLSRWGPEAIRTAQQLTSASLCGADIMWIGEEGQGLPSLTEGDDASLEQIWTVSRTGQVNPTQTSERRSILSFGDSEE